MVFDSKTSVFFYKAFEIVFGVCKTTKQLFGLT